jgi:outer membrane lipoprotein-sorting protein
VSQCPNRTLGPVSVQQFVHRHRGVRWLAPLAVVAGIGAVGAGLLTGRSQPAPLPPTSAAALLADVQKSQVTGFSGTVVAQMNLGLPDIPALATSQSDVSLGGLLSGTHTARVWYGGPDQQRIALLGPTSETDLFHSGRDVWEWDSDTHTAVHSVLPPDAPQPGTRTPLPSDLASLTPQQWAQRALDAMNPSTIVTTAPSRVVADRSAYEMVLTPRTDATKIGSVRIAVDGATKLPLAVQVYARGSSSPAIDIAYSDITFGTPRASSFQFAPPPGATVRTRTLGDHSGPDGAAPSFSGSAWTAIVHYDMTAQQVRDLGRGTLQALTPVSGRWGHGRLLDSSLVSVLITSDGHVFAGAVAPDALYAAATAAK